MKHYIGYGLALLAIATIAFLWHKNEIAIARAEEKANAQDQVIKRAQQEAVQAIAARDAANAQLERKRTVPATVKTVVQQLPVPLPTGSELKVITLPDSPAPQVVLSGDAQKNLNFVRDQLISHQECDNNLIACNAKIYAQNQQLRAVTSQRDTWKQTAKGGSKWHRMTKALEVIACAGGGAALGSLWKARGAAIGGAAGAGTCEIVF